jgi:hypothetical protein
MSRDVDRLQARHGIALEAQCRIGRIFQHRNVEIASQIEEAVSGLNG